MDNRVIELVKRKRANSIKLNSALDEVADRLDAAVCCIRNGRIALGVDEIIALAAYLRRINT